MGSATIIYLNGVSSVGKSSIAAALQEVLDEPYAHVALDHFGVMVPKPDGEAFFNRYVIFAMHGCVAAFAAAGANVIVDQVLLDPAWFADAVRRMQGYPVWFVGVQCALHELERREREPGNRRTGQAWVQLQRVHAHGPYDLEVDTTQNSPRECALEIKRRMHDGTLPRAFGRAAAHGSALP